MRYVWLIFAGLVAALVFVLPRLNRPAAPLQPDRPMPAQTAVLTTPTRAAALPGGPSALADSVVAFGLAQRGTPYLYAGTSPLTGFDCSGFIMYTFARFGVAVPHSTALLIGVGQPVAREEAQPGDIVVFTGTAPTSAVAGHAGIVISSRGQLPLRFVHSSSARRESGVKVSHVEGTDYERRFMQVRRVLGPGAALAARPRLRATAQAAAPVVALSARVVKATAPLPMALPKTVATQKPARATAIKKKASARTAATPRRATARRMMAKKPTTRATAAKKQTKRALPTKAAARPKRPGPGKRVRR